MKQFRWSNEDGYNAGQRNGGRLALAMIPAALGGAACLWILAAFGWIDLSHQMTARERALKAVGAHVAPSEPIKLTFRNAQCLTIGRAQ